MRTLREIHPDCALITVRPDGAAAYLTVPFLVFAALLPWLSQSATHGWLAPLGLAVPLLLALSFVRPRIRRVPLDAACLLRLIASNEGEDPGYEVVLVRGSREQRLLSHPSLSVVARDLGRILDATGATVESSAGVPVQYLRSKGEPPRRDPESATVIGTTSASHERVVRALFGGTLFVIVVVASGVLKAESPVSVLSVVLPLVCIVLLAAFGVWMASKRCCVRISEAGVDAEERGLGTRRRLCSIPAHELLGAVVVERGEVAAEVLIATTRGPTVLPLLGDAARRVADAIGPIAPANDVREPAPVPTAESTTFETRAVGRAAENRREARRSSRAEVARARQS